MRRLVCRAARLAPHAPATVALIIVAVLAVALAAQPPAAPDLILVNGAVFTADPSAPRVEAIAIQGGAIAARGTSDALRRLARPSTRVIDVGGRVVVPGFNDAHTHVGARPPGVVLPLKSDDPPLDEVIAALRETAARTPDGWIYGTVGERVLSDPKAARETFDAAAPGRLVKLAAWTGHGNLLSSAALHALEVGDRAADPPFGRYGRTDGGVVNGLLEEYADVRANRVLSRLAGRAAVVASLRRLANEAIGYGVTTIQAMGNAVPASDLAAMLVEADAPIRWRVIRFPISLDPADDPGSLGPIPAHPSALVTVSGTKWILDGTPVERLSALHAPYVDRPDSTGRLNLTPAQIETVLRRSLESGDQVMVHATGDRTIDTVLQTLERLAPASRWQAARPRIEHGDMLAAARLPQMRSFGVILVQNPSHFTIGELMRQRLGPDRSARIQIVKSTLAANVHVALGGDGPLNPFLNMMFAITHPGQPSEAMTREQVVTAYTVGSAYAEFAERQKGSLSVGKAADVAVLSQDIFSVPPDALPATRALLTIVDGRIVHDEMPRPQR